MLKEQFQITLTPPCSRNIVVCQITSGPRQISQVKKKSQYDDVPTDTIYYLEK
jgi:hypothetical protein